ncbi:hypothetical protein B0G77_6835 [Paraburkholderia sp. BL10I2N1]|nr:hypothetical protein B0G77_6835 [Paraburkholderia sp. BL10I2N1]
MELGRPAALPCQQRETRSAGYTLPWRTLGGRAETPVTNRIFAGLIRRLAGVVVLS